MTLSLPPYLFLFEGIRFVLGTAPQIKRHDGLRRKNETGKCIRENTALRTKVRGGGRVQGCHAAVCIEFAFGRLDVIAT